MALDLASSLRPFGRWGDDGIDRWDGSTLVRTVRPADAPADSQAVLMRVTPGLIVPVDGRETWAPEGLIAYSKVCTHAGCPVGLYQPDTHQLLCPCHQSAFDVLNGAKPVVGPAAWPLPQLPLHLDPDGILRARGDFSDPIGPGYWKEK